MVSPLIEMLDGVEEDKVEVPPEIDREKSVVSRSPLPLFELYTD